MYLAEVSPSGTPVHATKNKSTEDGVIVLCVLDGFDEQICHQTYDFNQLHLEQTSTNCYAISRNPKLCAAVRRRRRRRWKIFRSENEDVCNVTHYWNTLNDVVCAKTPKKVVAGVSPAPIATTRQHPLFKFIARIHLFVCLTFLISAHLHIESKPRIRMDKWRVSWNLPTLTSPVVIVGVTHSESEAVIDENNELRVWKESKSIRMHRTSQ